MVLGGFNSKLVRLKAAAAKAYAEKNRSRFNSKLVRLKAKCPSVSKLEIQEFQFQIGAIKSLCLVLRQSSFRDVSIPNWCD